MKDLFDREEAAKITHTLDEMKAEAGDGFNLETVNLAELERRCGVSRQRLRRLKQNRFEFLPPGNTGKVSPRKGLTGFTGTLDALLMSGVTNSAVCLERLREAGFTGGVTAVKEYIAAHKDLVPAKRHTVDPQGSRGVRYETKPGEAFQMDWGFVKVLDEGGNEYQVACFALCCHHCGSMFIEFFPNAKQENLFIGLITAFHCIGIPEYILTDNMKSVVDHRDLHGKPVWNREYEAFMKTVGFKTKLCKPRHPYTKGKVERLVRFVKGNFLAGRTFWNVTDLNRQALEWCDRQNNSFHKGLYGIPKETHLLGCAEHLSQVEDTPELRQYLCPLRRISFDGFVNYEGRRFGVPYHYSGRLARVSRQDTKLYIYSEDLRCLLATHEVTWSRRDSYCEDQYAVLPQPEERPTMPVKAQIRRLSEPASYDAFEKFNFAKGVSWDE